MSEERDRTLTLNYRLNGAPRSVQAPTSATLAYLVRDHEGLTGTKVACARGVCGACTVLVNDRPTAACVTFAFEIEGADITTIECQATTDIGHVQAAFADHSAFQCGYCTSGMIMLTVALLRYDLNPSRAMVTEWLSANVCRCTGYLMIVEAILDASRRLRALT